MVRPIRNDSQRDVRRGLAHKHMRSQCEHNTYNNTFHIHLQGVVRDARIRSPNAPVCLCRVPLSSTFLGSSILGSSIRGSSTRAAASFLGQTALLKVSSKSHAWITGCQELTHYKNFACARTPATVGRFPENPLSAPSRRYINLPNRPAGLPFSDAVLVGDTLYISGRIGLDPATGEAPANIDSEIELLFDGFQAVLREVGMTMDDLVWVQVYCPDVALWQQFNSAYIRPFSREFPARAFLGSGRLLLNGHFEMLGIAVKG